MTVDSNVNYFRHRKSLKPLRNRPEQSGASPFATVPLSNDVRSTVEVTPLKKSMTVTSATLMIVAKLQGRRR